MKTALSNCLTPSRLERILCLEETESTNTYLKCLAAEAPQGLAVLARRQSGGRGRAGRGFLSPEGGVYLSVLYRLGDFPTDFMPCAAVAVRRALRKVCGLELGIKWVNDLLLRGKKVCGILAEKEGDALIIGVGLNVNTPDFPPELPNAGSLASLGGEKYELAPLAAAIIEELDALAAGFPGNTLEYRREYAACCLNIGREVEIIQGESSYIAFAEALAEDFSLIVRCPEGSRERIFCGEVSIRGTDGKYV